MTRRAKERCCEGSLNNSLKAVGRGHEGVSSPSPGSAKTRHEILSGSAPLLQFVIASRVCLGQGQLQVSPQGPLNAPAAVFGSNRSEASALGVKSSSLRMQNRPVPGSGFVWLGTPSLVYLVHWNCSVESSWHCQVRQAICAYWEFVQLRRAKDRYDKPVQAFSSGLVSTDPFFVVSAGSPLSLRPLRDCGAREVPRETTLATGLASPSPSLPS